MLSHRAPPNREPKGRTAGQAARLSARLSCVMAFGLLLAACSSSSSQVSGLHRSRYQQGQPSYKVGAPYQINGVWYYPRVDYGYDQTGNASWYGEAFHGQATANGEIYDLNSLTAAHKTLPLPSVVEVTNLQNGRALRLRVNDRGPYVDGRIIDVSRRAAQLLGFEGRGVTPVRVRVLKEESIQVAQAAMRGQVGPVMLAEAAGSGTAPMAPRPARPPRREPPAPYIPAAVPAAVVAPAPMPPSRPAPAVEVASLPEPPAPPPRAVPEPSEPTHVAAAAPSATLMPPSPAPRRRYWPSLISQAHAEPLMLPPTPKPAPPPIEKVAARAGRGRMFIQAGAFAKAENAQKLRAKIATLGSVQVVQIAAHGTSLYRVRLGPLANRSEAERVLNRILGSGVAGAHVVAE